METEGETDKMKQQKLLNQNEIARKLGISRGTLSKWLKKNAVSPKQLKGQQKLYEETVIEQYKKDKDGEKERKKSDLSPTTLLLNQIEQQKKEIEYLKLQLDKKDAEIANKTEQIKENTKKIADFGSKFAKLADQSQHLNFLDKPSIEEAKKTVSPTVFETVEKETDIGAEESKDLNPKERDCKHWWQKIFTKEKSHPIE